MKHYIASDLRDMNNRTIFQLLYDHDEISRAELARMSGISMPTVIKIADIMREKNIILDMGERSDAPGRKPKMLKLNGNACFAVGVALEGEYIRCGIVNLRHVEQASDSRRISGNIDEVLSEYMPNMVDSLIQRSGVDPALLCGIGVGIPGGYNPQTHEIAFAPLINLNGPRNISQYETALSQRFDVPVFFGNDANMAAQGEYNARKDTLRDLLYITLGTGIGAGLILDGRLRWGGTNQCGEIGYVTLSADYQASRSGPGWLENRVNLRALRERFNFKPDVSCPPDIKQAVMQFAAEPLSVCIANIVTVLDCQTVVLDGMLSNSLGNDFLDCVQARVRRLCVLDVDVVPPLSADPGVLGAASAALENALPRLLERPE